MDIQRHEFILNSGEQIGWEYDREGDLLELFFRSGEATCAVELTNNIILRFDWETAEPVSLSFIDASRLLQSNGSVAISYELLTDEWTEETQEKVWKMLRSTPLSEFLKLGSFHPAHTHKIVPTTTVMLPQSLKVAA